MPAGQGGAAVERFEQVDLGRSKPGRGGEQERQHADPDRPDEEPAEERVPRRRRRVAEQRIVDLTERERAPDDQDHETGDRGRADRDARPLDAAAADRRDVDRERQQQNREDRQDDPEEIDLADESQGRDRDLGAEDRRLDVGQLLRHVLADFRRQGVERLRGDDRRVGQVQQQRVRRPVRELGVDRLDRLGERGLGGRRTEGGDDDRLDQRPGVDELAGAGVDDPVDDRLRDREPRALVVEGGPRVGREVVRLEQLLPGVEQETADQGEDRADDGEGDRHPAVSQHAAILVSHVPD